MNAGEIAFPHLGIYFKNVPTGFHVFGFYIAYYGLIIGIGVMAGIIMAARQAKKCGMNPDDIWDFALYAVTASIIGARIFYVIFSFDEYKDNLLEIFNVRNGGLAIYGGVIVAFTTLFIYTRIKKMSGLKLGDVCVPGLILGQIIGRWGNFMNREVFGGYTDNLLAMRIPVADVRDHADITQDIISHMAEGQNFIQVHPTFLYESLLNLIVLLLMLAYTKHKKFDGEICLIYLGGYGLVRFFVEGIRTDQLKIGHTDIAVSAVIGITLVIFSIMADLIARVKIMDAEDAAKSK